jgi:hypothetical protein
MTKCTTQGFSWVIRTIHRTPCNVTIRSNKQGASIAELAARSVPLAKDVIVGAAVSNLVHSKFDVQRCTDGFCRGNERVAANANNETKASVLQDV